MKKKLVNSAVALSLLALIVAFATSPAHGQTLNARTDKPAYVPGDTGTVSISIINPSGTTTLEIRNITVYYPWANFDLNGKWLSGANVSFNVSPFKVLTTVNGGGNNFTYTTPPFSVPSWWGTSGTGSIGCPGGGNPARYGVYSGCILLGTNSNGLRYDARDFSLSIAGAVYTPTSLSIYSQWVPVASLVVLIIATAILALVLIRLGNLPKKS